MNKYAVLDKNTNKVINVVIADNENLIMNANEYSVPASKLVEIGMVYDVETSTFPEIFNLEKLLNLKDEIRNLIIKKDFELQKKSHSTDIDLMSLHFEYLNRLKNLLLLEDYDTIKSQFDLIEIPPEILDLSKEITQDNFRSVLTDEELYFWDNPETKTESQKEIINNLKMEFPFYGIDSMNEMFSLLENFEIFDKERINIIKSDLS